MSSLFSIDNLLLNEDVNNDNDVIDLDNIGYYNYNADDFSFTNEGFRFVLEMQRDYINANKYFYDTLLESGGSDEIINEGFSEFWDGVKRIIKKFLDWLKKVCKEFAIKLMGLFKSDKYLKNKKNQELLKRFSDAEEFEYTGYEFTNLKPDIPKSNACDAIESNTLNLNITAGSEWYKSSTTSSYDNDTAKKALDNQYDAISENQEEFNDSFRASVLGRDDEISAGDYADELFEFFRDDASSPSAITIDSVYVTEALIRFDKFKDTIKEIEKIQKDTTKEYNKLETVLNRLISTKANTNNGETTYTIDYRNSTSSEYVERNVNNVTGKFANTELNKENGNKGVKRDVTDAMNKLCKLLSTRVTQMCSIHTQAFSDRLQAEKDRYSQDKAILYKALARVEHNINKNK